MTAVHLALFVVVVVLVLVLFGSWGTPSKRERMGWLSPDPDYALVQYPVPLGAAGDGVWPNAFAPPKAYDGAPTPPAVLAAPPTHEVEGYPQAHSEAYAVIGGPYGSYRYADVAWATTGWPRDALAPSLAEEPNWDCAGDARRHCVLSDGRPGKCVHNGYCAPVMLYET